MKRDGAAFRTRRRMVKGMVAAGGLTAVPWPFALAGAAESTAPTEVIRRTIPSSGESVPVAGMGTYRTFDIDPDDAGAMARMREVLRRFLAGGGRVIDSSPMYGRAEAVVGALAADLTAEDRLWLATKVWTRGREAGIEQMERSAARLGAGAVDLMQVHNLVDVETHLRTLRGWKDEGRIRYIGITHYLAAHHDALVRLIESHPVDFVQFNYNLLERNAERRLLPACAEHGIATLINEPFEQGRLFRMVRDRPVPPWASEIGCRTWAQLFLKYLIGHPAVTVVIPATGDPGHAAENVAAGRGAVPDEATRRRILDAVPEA